MRWELWLLVSFLSCLWSKIQQVGWWFIRGARCPDRPRACRWRRSGSVASPDAARCQIQFDGFVAWSSGVTRPSTWPSAVTASDGHFSNFSFQSNSNTILSPGFHSNTIPSPGFHLNPIPIQFYFPIFNSNPIPILLVWIPIPIPIFSHIGKKCEIGLKIVLKHD